PGSLNDSDTVHDCDASLCEVVEAVAALELDVHEFVVVQQDVEVIGVDQGDELTTGVTQITLDQVGQCLTVSAHDGRCLFLYRGTRHCVDVFADTVSEGITSLEAGGGFPLGSLDQLDDVCLVERLRVRRTVLSRVLGLEVGGSPVILIVDGRTGVRRGIDRDQELLVRNRTLLQLLPGTTAPNLYTTDAVTSVGVRVVLNRLVVGEASASE